MDYQQLRHCPPLLIHYLSSRILWVIAMVIDSIPVVPLLAAQPAPVLGLDAYGVIYNNHGPFDEIYGVFDYCKDKQIPIVMMTNNATQNIRIIEDKMAAFGLPIPANHIISSGCGLIELPMLRRHLDGQSAFVYGYPSSVQVCC